MLFGTPRIRKITPNRLQNGGQNDSKIALVGYLPKATWICYVLLLGHIGGSRGAPESHPKSSSIPKPLPDLIFPHFGRIWETMWVPTWLHVRSFSGPIFDPIFERIFGALEGDLAASIPSRTGGGFFSGDSLSGFTRSISFIRRRRIQIEQPEAGHRRVRPGACGAELGRAGLTYA